MKAAPIISNFNAGEMSPLMAGRTDIKYYRNATKKSRNFITTVQGPNRRRGGTRYVAAVKNSAHRTWLGKFEFNIEQVYVVEWGNLYARFFSNHGVVGAPFEVVTPYPHASLTSALGTFALRMVQSNDVQYITHADYRQQKLIRTGASTFTMGNLVTTGGPFKETDPDTAIAVYAGANTGAGVTFTASSAIFLAGHVGSLFYLEQKAVDDVNMWESGKAVIIGDVRRSDGKNYTALNAATTGGIKPTHSVGAKYDGDTGVQWEFNDPGYGWGTIISIGGGGTTAVIDIISRIPDNAVGAPNASTRWAHSSWSDVEGWPDRLAFHRDRLMFFRGLEFWGSVSGDYENFSKRDSGGLVALDMALYGTLSSDRSNGIEWATSLGEALLIGTAGDEHALTKITNSEAFGPGNMEARKQSDHGSRSVPIARVGDGIIYAQKTGRKIRDIKQAESVTDRWVSADLTVLAEHIAKGGITDMTYQQEPDSVLWGARSDGGLVGFTINREQDVRGWHPHRLGGYSNSGQSQFPIVESVISIPAPDFDRDELWMIVRRYIDGGTKRYVEHAEKYHEYGDDPQDAFYVDSGLTLDNTKNAILTPGTGADVEDTTGVNFSATAMFVSGDVDRYIHYRYSTVDDNGDVTWATAVAKITAYVDADNVTATINKAWPDLTTITALGWRMTVTTVSGLSHLEGQVVQVLTDGAVHPERTVASGAISLQAGASKVHVGKGFKSVMTIMPLDAGAADGTAQGKTQRTSRVVLRFYETLGAKYGRSEDGPILDQVLSRSGAIDMDEAPPLVTGDTPPLSWPDGYEGAGLITVVQDQPLPCCVVAIMPQVVTQDSR